MSWEGREEEEGLTCMDGLPRRSELTQPTDFPPTRPDTPQNKKRLGCRRPIGNDMRRRRYWALGSLAGAWRVYVEWDEGRRWGWYEGQEQLSALVEWLKKGGSDRERALLKALGSMPQGPTGANGESGLEPRLPPSC